MRPTDLIVHQDLFGEINVQQAQSFFGKVEDKEHILTFNSYEGSAEEFVKFFAEVFEPKEGIDVVLI